MITNAFAQMRSHCLLFYFAYFMHVESVLD